MTPARATILALALFVALAAAGMLRSPAGAASSPGIALETSATAAACGVHGCGCPHEEVAAGCCCAPGADEPPARALRVSLPTPQRMTSLPRADGLPVSRIESFRCSGGKHGRASARTSVSPAVHGRPAPSHALVGDRDWVEHGEPGPPYDLRSEPRTPPPRDARASRLG